MSNPSLEVIADGTFKNTLTDAETNAVIALAKEHSRKFDNCGLEIRTRGEIESIMHQAWREIRDEAVANAAPKPFTNSELEIMNAERRAFKSGQLNAQGDLVKLVGETKAKEAAARWCVSLGDIKTAGKNPYGKLAKKAMKAARTPELAITDVDPNALPKKIESNPWKGDSSNPAVIARRVSLIRSLPTAAVTAMAASAGVDLSGRPLKPRT